MKFGNYVRACTVVAAASLISACSNIVEHSNIISPSNQTELSGDVSHLLTVNHVASVSIATIKNGQMDWVGAYGEQRHNVPATTDTLYNIASLTKPLTAEIVLRLATKSKLSLDEAMDPYWSDPDLKDDLRRKRLTPRMALSHQTGFPNWRNPQTGLAFDRDPGTEWGYSGEGYQYLAKFAAAKLNEPFEKLATDALFGPANMASTSYTGQSWFAGRIATPNDVNGEALEPVIATNYNAADLVYSTAYDYALFMVAVLKDEKLTPEIGHQRSQNQISMMEIVCAGAKAESCPNDVGFGLGWQLLLFDGGAPIMMHTGKDDGVFTFAYIDRERREGAVILTNSDNGYKIILPLLERMDSRPAFLTFLRGQIS